MIQSIIACDLEQNLLFVVSSNFISPISTSIVALIFSPNDLLSTPCWQRNRILMLGLRKLNDVDSYVDVEPRRIIQIWVVFLLRDCLTLIIE